MTDPSPPRWAYLPFQISITVAALMLFDQAVFAGQFLSGTFGALQTHRDNATFSGIAVLIAAACAVFVRWPGKGPVWPLFASLGLFALIAVQIVLGFARLLTVHIPVGVAIIVLTARLVLWAWRARPLSNGALSKGALAGPDETADETAVRL
jgi:heme A synthase